MPLKRGSSNRAREENIKTEIASGKTVKQAVAIGYSEQRAAKKRRARDSIHTGHPDELERYHGKGRR